MAILDFFKSLWAALAPGRSEPAREPSDATDDPVPAPVAHVSPFAEALDDLEASIGAAIDAVTVPGDTAPGQVRNAYDFEAAQEMFASIAANYSRPVKSFIHELKRGTASKEWIQICQPVMGSIIDGAESLGLDAAARRMVEFREALALAHDADGRGFDEEGRELILSCYDGIVELLPAAFELAEEDLRRESILIHSLLRQIPEVGSVTLEKLYGAGVTSLEALFLATPDDLAAATGVPGWLCERICHKVRDHRAQLEGASPESLKADQRSRLVELIRELRGHQDNFQRIAAEDRMTRELAAEKRECLRARHACALRINVLLAELDRIDLVEQLCKMAVERRIERLEQLLAATVVGPTGILHGSGTTQDTHDRVR